MYNIVDTRINRCMRNGYARSRILNIDRKRNSGDSTPHYSLVGRTYSNVPLDGTCHKIPIYDPWCTPVLSSLTSSKEVVFPVTVRVPRLNRKRLNTRIENDLRNELLRTYDEYCQLLIAIREYVATNRLTH